MPPPSSMESAGGGYSGRRSEPGNEHGFSLPPPNGPQVPRTNEGMASDTLPAVNDGHPQDPQYTYTNGGSSGGHVHGSWPQPPHLAQQPLRSHHGYGGQQNMYQQPPGMGYGNQRNSHSPATGAEGLPPSSYDQQVHQPYQTMQGGPGPGTHPSNLGAAHPHVSPSGTGHLESYAHHRPATTNPYYAAHTSGVTAGGYAAYAPQHASPTHHSPTTTSAGVRGLNSIAGASPSSVMASPASYRPYQQYPPVPGMPGAVMSNIHQPGAQMSMVPGMPSMGAPGYGPLMYGSAPQPAAPPADRPFKCDQCTQSFSRNHDLKRHKRIHLAVKPFPCSHCSKSFSRKDALKRHRLVKGCESKTNGTNGANGVGADNQGSENSPNSGDEAGSGIKQD